MGRVVLFTLICVGAWWFLKRQFRGLGNGNRNAPAGSRQNSNPTPITDELVKDPVCGVYCPKREAVQMYYRGKTYHFCSRECKKRFLDNRKSKA